MQPYCDVFTCGGKKHGDLTFRENVGSIVDVENVNYVFLSCKPDMSVKSLSEHPRRHEVEGKV